MYGLLFYAIQKSKSNSVEALVEYGVNLNVNFIDDCYLLPPSTPLHWAVKNGNKEIAEYLIVNGADVNGKSDHISYPPLSWATIYSQPEMVLFLIKKGADVNAEDSYLNGATPLYLAAKYKNIEIARLLIANGAKVNILTRQGVSPLHQAAQNGDEAMARLLSENGADVNIKNKEKQTPLHIATLMGNKEIVEMLLKNGADINAEFTWQRRQSVLGNNRQWTVENIPLTPMDIAAQWNYLSIAQLLINNGAPRRFAMQRATEREHDEVLKLLVEADPNNKSDINECLLLAIRSNNVNTVRCLVDLGAEIDNVATSPEQSKFYMNEIKPGYVEVSSRPGSGYRALETPLHLAAELGYLDIVKYLVEKGVNPNVLNFLHKTPLDVAIINGHTEIADFLKDRTELPMPRLVGDFGSKEQLVFQGNKTFSKDQICKQLFMDTDIIVSLSPKASFVHYLNTLQEKIISGYKNNGFYEPQVNVSFSNEQQKILVEITEGLRYKKGQIVITGIDDPLKTDLIQRLKCQDLLEIYPDVSDMLMDMLKGTFKFPFNWNETDWACFDESFIAPAEQYVDQLLNLIGCYNAEFDLKVVPVKESHTAELRIAFIKEGTLAKIGTIDISGNAINTDEQVIEFLELKKGLLLNSLLTSGIQIKLRESGRFRQQSVSYDISINDPNNSTLKIDLQEVSGATPLGKTLSKEEELLKKVGEFFSDYKNWDEDLCFTLSMENKLPYTLEGFMSPKKGLILTDTDNGEIVNTLDIQPDNIRYSSLLLGHKVLFKPGGQIIIQFTISPDSTGEHEWSMFFGCGMSGGGEEVVQNELGYDLQFDIPPAFWISQANESGSKISYVDNIATIELKRSKDSDSTMIQADRETGRIIEINNKWQSGSCNIHLQKGVFDKQIQKINSLTASDLKTYETKSFDGLLLLAGPLYLTHSATCTLSLEQKRKALQVWSKILTSDVGPCFSGSEKVEDENSFALPHYDSMDSMNKMISFFAGAAFSWCHENLPQDHWLHTLTRVTALAVSGHGQNEAVAQGMQTLYTSDQIGPVGYYLIAKSFQQFGYPAYTAFSQRAWQSLSPDGFHKDWYPLVSGNFKLARNIRCTFDKLREYDPQDIHSAASIFPTKVGVHFETIINRLKESKEMTLAETLEDVSGNEWPVIKERIQKYLSELNSKTNSEH